MRRRKCAGDPLCLLASLQLDTILYAVIAICGLRVLLQESRNPFRYRELRCRHDGTLSLQTDAVVEAKSNTTTPKKTALHGLISAGAKKKLSALIQASWAVKKKAKSAVK